MRVMVRGVIDLDGIDKELLEVLQRDCKTPLAKLGKRVSLSAPAVLDRIRKLEAAGVITGYHAQVDGRQVGLDITAFIGISINYPRDIEHFLGKVAEWPEVLECHHVTGGHTLLLKVKTRNTASLEQLISSLRRVECVTATETMVVLSTATERARVPIPEVPTDDPDKRRRRR